MRSMMAIAAFMISVALPLPALASAQDSNFSCRVDGTSFVLDDSDFAAMSRGGMTREKFAASSPGSSIRISVCDTRALWRLIKAGNLNGCEVAHHKNWVAEFFSSAETSVVFEPMLKERNAVEFGGRKCS